MNMLNILKKNALKKQEFQQRNICIKYPNWNSAAEEYKDWIENFSRGIWQQTWLSRRISKTSYFKSYSQRSKKKKIEWRVKKA